MFVRNEVKSIIIDLLGSWEGPNKDKALEELEASIDTADECGRNNIFSWYINCVAPIMHDQAAAEGK